MYLKCTDMFFFPCTGKKTPRIIMAIIVDNCTFISSNCSNSTLMHITNDNFVCLIGFYIHVVVICIMILPPNIWALWLIRKNTTTQKRSESSDLLHINLIFASVMFCIAIVLNGSLIFNMPYTVIYVSSSIMCITLMAQAQFHTWSCMEYYLAVVHPIFYLKLKQSWYKMMLVSFTWATSSVLGVQFLIMQQNIAMLLYIITFCGLVLLILFCSVATLAMLKKPNPGEGERGEKMHHQKIKAFKIITLTLVVLIFTYSPYICLVFLWQNLYTANICLFQSLLISFLLPGAAFQSVLYISRFFKARIMLA